MNVLTARARAKVNLTLHICGRRPDGFHDLESIVAQIELADDVSVEARPGSTITLDCSNPAIPTDDSNLALRAARLLQGRAASIGGAHITLSKRIPPGAGLGGGSSNAASTLLLLNRLWDLSIALDELADIAAALGSDVPLFLRDNPLKIMRGRGEKLEPISACLEADLLLALPPISCPTAAVYAAFAAAGRKWERPSAKEIVQESFARDDSQAIVRKLIELTFNDLEHAALGINPDLADFARRLRIASNYRFCMSGSGAAFFALFPPRSIHIGPERERLAAQFPNVQFVVTQIARGA